MAKGTRAVGRMRREGEPSLRAPVLPFIGVVGFALGGCGGAPEPKAPGDVTTGAVGANADVVLAVDLAGTEGLDGMEADARRAVTGTVLGMRQRTGACTRYVELRIAVEVVLTGRVAQTQSDDGEVAHDLHVVARLPGERPGCEDPAVRAVGLPRLAVGDRVVLALRRGGRSGTSAPPWTELERVAAIAPLYELPRVAASLPEPELDVDGEQDAFIPRLPGVGTPRAKRWLGDAPRFERKGEEVTDRALGVVWQRGTAPRPLLVNESAWYCDALRLGGHDDWRLPTAVELHALLEPGGPPPALRDRDLFPSPATGFLWSRTDDDGSYVGDLEGGAIISTHYDDPNPWGPYATRCVRGADAPKTLATDRFAADGPSLVDGLAALNWYLPASPKPLGHADAKRACEEATYLSKDDWRLPTEDETFSLMTACPAALRTWADALDEVEIWTSLVEPQTTYGAIHRVCDPTRSVPQAAIFQEVGAPIDPRGYGLCVREVAAIPIPPMEACPGGGSARQVDAELRCEIAGVAEGPFRSTYPSGAVFEVGQYEHGVRTGAFTMHHELGGPWATGRYAQGKLDGDVVVTRQTGRPRAKLTYGGGVPSGAWTFADGSGREIEKLAFDGGKPGAGQVVRALSESEGDGVTTCPTVLGLEHGVERTVDSKGRLSAEVTFASGAMEGPFTFYADGGGTTKGEHRDGARQGLWTTTRADGSLESRSRFVDGLLDGEYELFDEKGARTVRAFKEGAMIGKFELRDADGKITTKGDLDTEGTGTMRMLGPEGAVTSEDRYLRGKRNGAQRNFHADGKLRHEVTYDNGKKNGAEVDYHSNGKVRTMVTYRDGVLEGPTREVSEDGTKVLMTGAYAAGLREGPWMITLPTGQKLQITFSKGRAVSGDWASP